MSVRTHASVHLHLSFLISLTYQQCKYFFSCDSDNPIISSPVCKGHLSLRTVHQREPVSIRVCEGMKKWTNLQFGKDWEDWEDWETTRHSAAVILG